MLILICDLYHDTYIHLSFYGHFSIWYLGDFWEPRKRDPDLTESGFRGLDVLALLVSIYGKNKNEHMKMNTIQEIEYT